VPRLEITLGGRSIPADVDAGGRVTIDDESFTVEPLGNGDYTVSNGARQWVVAVAGPADDRWVSVDGRVAQIEIAEAGRDRKRRRASGSDALAAPMPATVVQVLVTPGAVVTEGETLLMLEAMKMELPVRAPRSGTVRAIRCQPGDLVQPGVPLLELEP
jgi:biotin carboxyl carrier protein